MQEYNKNGNPFATEDRLLVFKCESLQTDWWITIPAIGFWCHSFLKPWQLSPMPHWAMPNGFWELLQAVGAVQFGMEFSALRTKSRRDFPQHSKVAKKCFQRQVVHSELLYVFAAATPARCFSCEECCSCTIGLFEEVVVLQASNCRLQIGPANVILDFLWVLVLCYFPSGLAVDMHQCPNFSHSKHGCRVQVLKNL